jgi:hypothetical protein
MKTGLLSGSDGLASIAQLYGIKGRPELFAAKHIELLKNADFELANRAGEVLQATNDGFGMTAQTAFLVIGVGQALLGNPLNATVVTTTAVAANPLVMTCAAVGAIVFGWQALKDDEREALLGTVSRAFSVGVELIRSVATFAIEKFKALLPTKEQLAELKRIVGEGAAYFGRTLGQVTGALSDLLWESTQRAAAIAGDAASTAWSYVPSLRRSE